jgi:hypothetical protein
MKMESLRNLESMIAESPELTEQNKEKMLAEVKEAKTPLQTDKWIYRIVVGALAVAILTCLAFTFVISLRNTDPNVSIDMPEIFMAIGSAAVGALAGLLAPSPGRSSNEN